VLAALYHSSAHIAANGHTIGGATANVTDNVTVSFDVGYDLTKNISLMLMAGVPPIPAIHGEGAVASLKQLGRVKYGPAILTAIYRSHRSGALHPYAGIGVAYAIIFKEHDGSVSQLDVHNDWGFVVQFGAEYRLRKNLEIYLDFKEIWLGVDARGRLADGSLVNARVTLDPTLISFGVKFHFH
jgi:outer membrane protein